MPQTPPPARPPADRSSRSPLARGRAWRATAAALAALVACAGGTDPRPAQVPAQDPGVPQASAFVDSLDVAVDVGAERAAISPYVYGSNQDVPGLTWTARRLGGNRLTAYNWETNFSNAGSDYLHNSDLYLLSVFGIPTSEWRVPARTVADFLGRSAAMGARSLVTLPMAGYVAADSSGPVSAAEAAPSSRWVRVAPRKGAPFTLSPDRTDGVVYDDEFVNFLVRTYGNATSPTGVRWYSLDNEPALWAGTHPRVHPQPVGAVELVERSTALASAVKDVDPTAEVTGPAAYGFAEFLNLQDAPDWNAVRGGSAWYLDYYLTQMRQAEARQGRRLLDVLDLHWYPEARGDHRIVDTGANTPQDDAARLQAPRTLWDSTYRENSWIAQSFGAFLPILPRVRQSIDRSYPGTKLAVTEYDYGAGDRISGGLAQADVLGAFGRQGVYLAMRWGMNAGAVYAGAGFRLFRDYDGAGGTYGNTGVRAVASDAAKGSVYAAIRDQNIDELHLILINKGGAGPVQMRVRVAGGSAYSTGAVWGFDASGAAITRRADVQHISGGAFTYVVPALSAVHVVLR